MDFEYSTREELFNIIEQMNLPANTNHKLWEGNMTAGKIFNMAEEFDGLDFHSVRLEHRFIRSMETIIEQPDKSIWYSSENRANT
jgi:hypothetical protein